MTYDREARIQELMDRRAEARDYATRDRLRAELRDEGVQVKDTRSGSEYHWIRSSSHLADCPCKNRKAEA